MKRFFADALLVLVLVAIGSYINQKEEFNLPSITNEKVEQFESDVAQNKVVEKKVNTVVLADTTDNGASRMAKSSSELVEQTIRGTVGLFSSVFDSLIK